MSVRASHLIINDVDYEIWDTVARNSIGAPATASTVAGMTDTSKVYVYTGSETGYTAGNWYYYNGSAWVSGGVYNSTAFETDETLTEQGAAADAKAVGDAIADIQSDLVNKANVDGAYEQMTVGNAEQLVSSVGIEDSVPYNFRTSGGSADIGDREVDKIVGGTVAWNQRFPTKTLNYTETGFTLTSNNDGVWTITVTETATSSASVNHTNIGANVFSANHVHLLFGDDNAHGIYIYLKAYQKGMQGLFKPSSPSYTNVSVTFTDLPVGTYKLYPQVFDLTQMFGSTIADYIYSLEQSTAGAGVAWFRKLFPKPYYAYNAGELMSVQTSAHKMVGFNAWDEEWEEGGISTSTGGNITSSGNSRTKNYIPVIPSTAYYFKTPVTLGLRFYDADKNIVGNYALSANSLYTMPSDCHYLRFVMVGVTQYANNVCVNISWDGERDGEYEEYKQWVYPLDSDLVLRGIPKLSSGNDLYYDGDTYESDGTVTRKYGIRAYQNGDETDGATMITDGTNTVYALTTPTTESADAYQNPQIVEDFGTEEYVDDRDVAIPVGHETFYQANLKAKLEMAPNSPDGDGDYVVRQTNGQNEYVPLLFPASDIPSAPSENGTYVLKCTVANGTPSFSWTAES